MSTPLWLTGERGYIGSALKPALQQAGYMVYASPAPVGIHLAAQTLGDFSSNIYLTATVVEDMPAGGRLVFASSLTADHPQDRYDHEKRLGERICQARPDIEVVILRLGSVYGEPVVPNRRSALNILLQQGAKGYPLSVYGNALGLRDYVHLSDVVRAFVLALKPSVPPGRYEVSGGAPATLLDAAIQVAKQAGVSYTQDPDATMQHLPIAQESAWLPGWEPKVTLEEGITRTMEWVAKQEQRRLAG